MLILHWEMLMKKLKIIKKLSMFIENQLLLNKMSLESMIKSKIWKNLFQIKKMQKLDKFKKNKKLLKKNK